MKLTAAVCTYNPDRALLTRTIEAIVGQLAPEVAAEVIVVDNNSQPSLSDGGYLSHYPIRIIAQPQPGLTAAREAAIQAAKGELILFVDDDNIVGAGYLATVVTMFADDPTLGLLGGCVLPEYAEKPPRWTAEFEQQLAVRRYSAGFYAETTDLPHTAYYPVGAGFAVRRVLAQSYLRDCEETGRIEGRRGATLSAGEDIDLGLYVLTAGYKLAVTGSLTMTHVIPRSRLTRTYLQRLAVGSLKSAAALERKWAPRFGRPVFAVFSEPASRLALKTAASGVLGLWSPRYRVKFSVFRLLMRIRLARTRAARADARATRTTCRGQG